MPRPLLHWRVYVKNISLAGKSGSFGRYCKEAEHDRTGLALGDGHAPKPVFTNKIRLEKRQGSTAWQNIPRANVINSAQRLAKYFAQY
jgi:hypothetical protein